MADYTSLEDQALMAAYVRGEEAAFEELFVRYSPLLLRLTRRHLGNEDLAKDVTQQSFLQLHRARNDFRPGSKLRPYLVTIAMNLVREHYRRASRKKEEPLDTETRRHPEPAADAVGTTRLQEAEQAARVRRALLELPDTQRVVIEMHWFQERSFSEISVAVGASLSAVKVRAHRGYKSLRKLLAPPTRREENT